MTTAPTTHESPFLALYRDLATIYDTDGREEVFRSSVKLAREHGLDKFWQVAFAVYTLGKSREDDSMAASAMASYAQKALPDYLKDELAPEARCAYIAVMTAGAFDGLGCCIHEVAAWCDDPDAAPLYFDAGDLPPAKEERDE